MYSISGCPACAGVAAGEVEGAEGVGWFAGEVYCGAGEVKAAADGLPTTADGLPSSLGFGDDEQGRVGEEVGAGDEDLDVDKDAPCASLALPAHAYSTVKLQSAVANPSSTALSHAQPRPSLNTTSRTTCTRHVTGPSTW
jgi:hypothetical protein